MKPSLTTACGLYPRPVRNSSWPVLEVSMWPLNIRFLPPPDPFQRPTTLARASSTSCQVMSRPSFCSADCMYCAICSSSPVGLGMLITSVDMETISSSRTSARMRSMSFSSRLEAYLMFVSGTVGGLQFAVRQLPTASATFCQTEIVWVGAQLLVAGFGDQKIVFQTQASAARPVNARLDCQHHAFFYSAGACLVRVGPLVGAGTDAVADGVGGLSGVSTFGDARSNELVEFGKARSRAREGNGAVEDFKQ